MKTHRVTQHLDQTEATIIKLPTKGRGTSENEKTEENQSLTKERKEITHQKTIEITTGTSYSMGVTVFDGCRKVGDPASVGPQIWTGPAVEGGRMTADECLTTLPRPVYLHPPDGATRTEVGRFFTAQGLTGTHWAQGAHLVPNYPEEGTEANPSNLLRCSPTHAHICTSATSQITSRHIRSNFSCAVLI